MDSTITYQTKFKINKNTRIMIYFQTPIYLAIAVFMFFTESTVSYIVSPILILSGLLFLLIVILEKALYISREGIKITGFMFNKKIIFADYDSLTIQYIKDRVRLVGYLSKYPRNKGIVFNVVSYDIDTEEFVNELSKVTTLYKERYNKKNRKFESI